MVSLDSPREELFSSMPTQRALVVNLIQQIVNEEVDQALAASEKRREEFKSTFGKVFTEVDSLNLGKAPLNLEADAAAPAPTDQTPAAPAPTATAPAPTPDATAPGGTPAAPPGGDPNAPATGVDPALAGAPGGPGGVPGAPGGDPTADADGDGVPDGGGDAGGGGGSFGFGGGGGGGGGGGTEDGTGGGEGGEEGAPGGEPEAPEGDPIVAMVSGAQELLSQTQDPSLILKSLKGQVQTLFQEPEHALGLVKALYDTKDSILQSVAQRLYLFLKTKTSN